MKLCQGQVWKKDGQYIRIVRLERLEVEYKSMTSLTTKEGTTQVTSKKDFCRLLKGAHLLAPDKKTLPVRNDADTAAPCSKLGNCNARKQIITPRSASTAAARWRKSAPPTACWPSSIIPT